MVLTPKRQYVAKQRWRFAVGLSTARNRIPVVARSRRAGKLRANIPVDAQRWRTDRHGHLIPDTHDLRLAPRTPGSRLVAGQPKDSRSINQTGTILGARYDRLRPEWQQSYRSFHVLSIAASFPRHCVSTQRRSSCSLGRSSLLAYSFSTTTTISIRTLLSARRPYVPGVNRSISFGLKLEFQRRIGVIDFVAQRLEPDERRRSTAFDP